MGQACRGCNGMGYTVNLEADVIPCPTCQPAPEDAAHTYEVAMAIAKRRPPSKTIEGVDGPVDPSKADEVGVSAIEAGFPPGQIEAQAAQDLERMRKEG